MLLALVTPTVRQLLPDVCVRKTGLAKSLQFYRISKRFTDESLIILELYLFFSALKRNYNHE